MRCAFPKGTGISIERTIFTWDECVDKGFDNDFETGEDGVEIEEGATFLGEDDFLLASNLSLSFFSFLETRIIFFLLLQRSIRLITLNAAKGHASEVL